MMATLILRHYNLNSSLKIYNIIKRNYPFQCVFTMNQNAVNFLLYNSKYRWPSLNTVQNILKGTIKYLEVYSTGKERMVIYSTFISSILIS